MHDYDSDGAVRPLIRPRFPRRGRVCWILACLVLLPACGTEPPAEQAVGDPFSLCLGDACTSDSDCADNGRCNLRLEVPRCMTMRCSQDGEACDDRFGDLLCEPNLRCNWGRCEPGGGRWADDPCRKTESCRVFGKCTTLQGVCQAWDDADCQGSEECALSGECAAGDLVRDQATPLQNRARHRTCWPVPPCDTALGTDQVNSCAEVGLCTETSGRCLATSAERCGQSEACVGTGACDVKDGECWRTVTEDSQCATGAQDDDVCVSFGFCAAVEGACNAVENDHCKGSFLCETWGECWAWDGECWARPF